MGKKVNWFADEEPCSIQMGPMIDCTFLLLMYFISVSMIETERMSMQKEINAIVEADADYAQLKLKRDILATVMPDLPKPPGGPMGGRPMIPPPSMRLPTHPSTSEAH